MKTKLNIDLEDLKKAEQENVIEKGTAEKLFSFLSVNQQIENSKSPKQSKFATLLYYLGGLLSIFSIAVFMSLTFDVFGKEGLLGFFVGLFILGLYLENKVKHKEERKVAAIFTLFSYLLVPPILLILQDILGLNGMDLTFDNYHKNYQLLIGERLIYIEVLTVIIGFFMFLKYKYSILLLPLLFFIWYLLIDVVLLITDLETSYTTFELRKDLSLYIGLIFTIIGLVIDHKLPRKNNYAFWFYFIGVSLFWGS